MRSSRTFLASVALLAVLGAPAFAQQPDYGGADEQDTSEEEEAPAPGWPFSVTIDNSVGFNSEFDQLYSEHGMDLYMEATRGNWTFSADLWLGLYGDLTNAVMYLSDPTLELNLSNEKFGELQWWDAGSALSEACVQPAGGSANVGNEDIMAHGTCSGFTAGESIIYITPEMGGFKVLVSGMSDVRGIVEVGEVDSAVSAALAYSKAMGDVTFSASLGVDHALSVKGGLAPGENLPTTVQGGIAAEWATWRLAAAGQVDVVTIDGTPVWSAGIGVEKTVMEKLKLTAELATDHYEDAGDPIQEVSVGTTAELTLIPDTLTIDAGANVLKRTSPGGVDDLVYQVETGFEVSF
jgi:hypothetical protein